MKIYKYILFDWDGCLARTLQVWLATYKTLFTEYGVEIEEKEITEHVFGDISAPAKYGVKDNDNFMNKMFQKMNEEFKHIGLNQHAKEVLDILKEKNKNMAIISTSSREGLIPALEFNHLSKYFPIVLAKEDVTKHKPDPEVINKALEKMGGNKKEAIIIGDSKKDIEAGYNAKVDSMLYYPPEHSLFYNYDALMSLKPTYVIKDLLEIPLIIK